VSFAPSTMLAGRISAHRARMAKKSKARVTLKAGFVEVDGKRSAMFKALAMKAGRGWTFARQGWRYLNDSIATENRHGGKPHAARFAGSYWQRNGHAEFDGLTRSGEPVSSQGAN
jgi:hypothetical protein